MKALAPMRQNVGVGVRTCAPLTDLYTFTQNDAWLAISAQVAHIRAREFHWKTRIRQLLACIAHNNFMTRLSVICDQQSSYRERCV